MQMSLVPLSVLCIASSTILSSLGRCADVTPPTPVEFRYVGDDGLSQKLVVAVLAEFRRSPDFRLTARGEDRTLVVTITRNVEWEMIGKRTRATYTVKFSSLDGREIGTKKGFCWESALRRCAAQIVSEAKIAAREVSR